MPAPPAGEARERLRRASEPDAFTYYPNLKRVHDYVEQHLQNPITLEEAAGVAGLERCYFSTYFRLRAGIRFSDWLSALRIAHALILIHERDRPLDWVAHRVGFGERRSFQRAFKRWTGRTAQEYRAEVRDRVAGRSAADGTGGQMKLRFAEERNLRCRTLTARQSRGTRPEVELQPLGRGGSSPTRTSSA